MKSSIYSSKVIFGVEIYLGKINSFNSEILFGLLTLYLFINSFKESFSINKLCSVLNLDFFLLVNIPVV